MKGIVLAGGLGSRLSPLTDVVCKQLLPIFDKPMIYYPLSVLMLAKIKEILLICSPRDLNLFKKLLGSGEGLGIEINYAVQESPKGIAEALLIGDEFIGQEDFMLVLGDNIFWGGGFSEKLRTAVDANRGATIFSYKVSEPESFGIVKLNKEGKPLAIVEKPTKPESNNAVTGLYIYDRCAIDYARELKPSPRGELEITDINRRYLERGCLSVKQLGRGYAWLDTGTHHNMLAASTFVETIEARQGYKIACLEEIALQNSWITHEDLLLRFKDKPKSSYNTYVHNLALGVFDD